MNGYFGGLANQAPGTSAYVDPLYDPSRYTREQQERALGVLAALDERYGPRGRLVLLEWPQR